MEKKKYAVVLTGGYSPQAEIIRNYTDGAEYIVAADSGFDIAVTYNIQVDFVVGDMDSVKQSSALHELPHSMKKVVSHEKDETDTELALQTAWDMGFDKIVLIGGGGGRLDHIIGILWLFERNIRPSIWITDNETVIFINEQFESSANIGEHVSLFPLSSRIEGLTSEGLKWSLKGLQWKRGDIGLSNETVDTKFSVKLKQGSLLLIMNNRRDRTYV